MTMAAWNGVGNEEGDNEAGLSSVGADLLLRARNSDYRRGSADISASCG